ncbi:NHLP bacteriocin system secretion protein [Bradyrhizobium sp. CB1717]|uniref:HlyD family secretion protein n=1 Tax=Bradyrhizobium huanghuaihaiense TaxID=990078 RepID=A0A562R2P4_9BRAD|nr:MULTISPECIES: NHLP bacteriocin system secretion protein [Bradyrhizobium]TWI63329.1 HlyD family secretion protein [Bradyrhizobium huanghuaihaiense]WFU22979.1 NHLP bacteriocin system secretion protein [Bradyrhizobium sp. CB1717]
MKRGTERIFREAAIERLSNPEQLDHVVGVTRPFDWVAAAALALGLVVLIAWSVLGRIPTRVSGDGILLSSGGRLVDAVSAVSGKLAALEIGIGDTVRRDQVIARVAQTETEQRLQQARDVLREREREHAELVGAISREIDAKLANYTAQEAGLANVIAAAEKRSVYLTDEVAKLEPAAASGIVTRKYLEDRRVELNNARERITDARNDILKLNAQRLDLQSQRERDRLLSEFKINDAKRTVEHLGAELERGSRILSPADGRVVELKVSGGAVLAVGTSVIEIETAGQVLEATVYMPADRGKTIRPGMEVRIEPNTIKREEYGAIVGNVVAVSDFPVTPQGMLADLHNDALVKRFSQDGAPYAAKVALARDASTFSGYRWTSGKGPPIPLSSGTLTRAEVTTREQPPIDLVIPLMKRLSGIGG